MDKVLIDVSHFISVNYVKQIGSEYLEYIAFVNSEELTEQEAMKIISAEEYNPHIIIMTKAQYDSLFKGRRVK